MDAIALMKSKLLEPLVPYLGAMARWECRCLRCGDITSPTYASIQQGQGGCVRCAGQKRITAAEAIEIMQASGLSPLVEYPGARPPWLCRCNRCGREVTPRLHNVQRGHAGCAWCAQRLTDPVEAEERMRNARLKPLVPYPGKISDPWLCRCMTCDREVSPRYDCIKNGQGGCRWCSPKGTDYAAPGFIYLVTHSGLAAHKIGIRNEGTDRIVVHRRQGWRLHRERHFRITDDALKVEQAIIRWWRRDLGLPRHLEVGDMPHSGHTETVSADALSLPDIWSKVCELADGQRTSDPDDVCDDVELGQLVLF